MTDLLLASAASHGEQGRILAALAFVLVGAKLLGALVERVGQPAVLGELVFGILLGNLALFGGPSLVSLQGSETFAILAELGAILLLFEVGLESTPRDMLAVGIPATKVALAGVVMPMALGFGVGMALLPGESWMVHAFLGAMLAATSVGITARVLQDAQAIRTPSARIILGAAVIDDVLGLVVLAIIAGVIRAAALGQTLEPSGNADPVGSSVLRYSSPRASRSLFSSAYAAEPVKRGCQEASTSCVNPGAVRSDEVLMQPPS